MPKQRNHSTADIVLAQSNDATKACGQCLEGQEPKAFHAWKVNVRRVRSRLAPLTKLHPQDIDPKKENEQPRLTHSLN